MAKSHTILLSCFVLLLTLVGGCSVITDFPREDIAPDGSVLNRVETPQGTLIAWAGDFRPDSKRVVGWAAFEDDETPVELEVVNSAGDVIGMGTADLDRPDVMERGHTDRANVGYVISVSPVESGEELTVRLAGGGTPLPNNPILAE